MLRHQPQEPAAIQRLETREDTDSLRLSATLGDSGRWPAGRTLPYLEPTGGVISGRPPPRHLERTATVAPGPRRPFPRPRRWRVQWPRSFEERLELGAPWCAEWQSPRGAAPRAAPARGKGPELERWPAAAVAPTRWPAVSCWLLLREAGAPPPSSVRRRCRTTPGSPNAWCPCQRVAAAACERPAGPCSRLRPGGCSLEAIACPGGDRPADVRGAGHPATTAGPAAVSADVQPHLA